MQPESLYIALLWAALIAVSYTQVGYPLILWLLNGRGRQKEPLVPSKLPHLSVVIASNQPPELVEARIQNLLESTYPEGLIEIVLVFDGVDVGEWGFKIPGPTTLRVISKERGGKPAALNAGVAQATAPIIVFTDDRQKFAPDTLEKLVANFQNSQIGAVSGSLEIASTNSQVGNGVQGYWKLERKIREWESHIDSSIGCTGAVYAIRKSLWEPIPNDTLLDDVVIPMNIATKGYGVKFEPTALALDPQPTDPQNEVRRKRRTTAGNYQMLFRHWRWLLPWKNRLWWQLISHKYLRILTPLFLIVALTSNALLLSHSFYLLMFAAQIFCYGLALIGMASAKKLPRWVSLPAAFVFMNLQAAHGLIYYLSKRGQTGWRTA